jgi:hypothetical protein
LEREVDSYWIKWTLSETPLILVFIQQGKILGFFGGLLKIRKNISQLTFQDFGVCESEYQLDKGESIFVSLAQEWIRLSSVTDPETISISIPAPVANDWSITVNAPESRDVGFMYRSVIPSPNQAPDILFDESSHVFWPSDGY